MSDCGPSAPGYCLRKASIRSPNDDGRRGECTHPRNSQARKSAGVVLEGEGRQRRRVIRMEGAFLLPTIRRSQSINGLLYARERVRAEKASSSNQWKTEKREKRLGRAGGASSGFVYGVVHTVDWIELPSLHSK